ncbi:MAG: hypothetical protein ABH851_04265 [Methanobacteriota archaeon]
MKSRAHAAVEYLATYGWGVLVVLAIGFALWQLGFLRLSGEQFSASGYSKIRPYVPTCEMKVGPASYNEFSCYFITEFGTQIIISEHTIEGFMNGKPCMESFFEVEGSILKRVCQDLDCTTFVYECSGQRCSGSPGSYQIFAKDKEAFKMGTGSPNDRQDGCGPLDKGQFVDVTLNVEYSTYIPGGIKTGKELINFRGRTQAGEPAAYGG